MVIFIINDSMYTLISIIELPVLAQFPVMEILESW